MSSIAYNKHLVRAFFIQRLINNKIQTIVRAKGENVTTVQVIEIALEEESANQSGTFLKFHKFRNKPTSDRNRQEKRNDRRTIAQKLLQRSQNEDNEFWTCIVTGDVSWFHHYEPEKKCQYM
ncbi:hypothetical protein C0J52_23934 [Blattella germanica]|nr:hypothetical protein C0J52_23934 [Blattella germanica]